MMSRDVEFGLSLPNRAVLFGLDPHVLFQTTDAAEASGQFGSVWVRDNFTSSPINAGQLERCFADVIPTLRRAIAV